MGQTLTLLVAAAVVFGFLAVEAVRASRNERAQRAKGALEPPGDVYSAMRVAYPGAFLAMLAEGALGGGAPTAAMAAGAAMFAASKALKWWAIVTLGQAWTFRVLVVPGAPRIRRGPYRLLRHPNYVGVVGELAGVGLLAGAAVTGPLALVGFGALIAQRVRVEERALAVLDPTASSNV